MSRRSVHKKDYSLFTGYDYYTPWLKGILALLLWLMLGSLLGSVITAVLTMTMGSEAALEYGMLISYPVMFLPAMMFASFKSRSNLGFDIEPNPIDRNGFGQYSGVLLGILAVLGTIALAFMMDAVNSRMPQMPDSLKEILESQTQGKLWANILSVSIFAPFCEEWLCRGEVLRGLLSKEREDGSKAVSPALAIMISALFFALIHANPWQAVPAFAIGCLFGYVYYKTGSLKLTMLMHCANNTFAVICSRIDSFQDKEFWTEVLPPPQYWLLFAACALLLVLIVRVFKRIKSA